MINYAELLKRATPAPEPLICGHWGILFLRPDLGSQQEFAVGVIATIENDETPHLKWLPSFSRLSSLYGDALTSTDVSGLTIGSELAIRSSFTRSLSHFDCGTPHVRIEQCGYFSTDDLEKELTRLLKRQSGAIWQEPQTKEATMDDDWAYSTMLRELSAINVGSSLFVPHRSLTIENKTLSIAMDSGKSYANIVSARYASYSTVERHIYTSMLQVTTAHRLSKRNSQPALFVVLPDARTSIDAMISRKTAELLGEVEDSGILQFCEPSPGDLASRVELWANA